MERKPKRRSKSVEERKNTRTRRDSRPGQPSSRGRERRPSDGQERKQRGGQEWKQRSSHEPEAYTDRNRDDLIFGRHTVMSAMSHQRPLNRIWLLPQLKRNPKFSELLSQCKAQGAVIDETSTLRLDQLTQHANHQGIVAQVGACKYLNLEELIHTAREKTDAPVLVAVDGITDPHNLGAIIRSAEAMGAQGIVLPQRRAASVGATVAKVAAGALDSLPIARVVNLNQALESLKKSSFWVYGLTLDADAPINSVNFSGAIVLLIGSEGRGLSSVTQKHCDGSVKIPLTGETESLNASVAAGIGIYEIFRQRLHQQS
ncbi:MAG: 23S rRNA (guanosine(2251)-2'-O)-methyltransferase RlmB [Cyanobacteria bacterium P01_F01_bin.42]